MSDTHLQSADTRHLASTRELLAGMRRRSTEHLQGVLARVFARADDWLFDMAKKDGVPDGSPHLYAMRALRTSRAPIERGFRQFLDRQFGDLERRTRTDVAGDVTELKLVEEAELEQQLATTLIAEAIVRVHGSALEELGARMAQMFGVPVLDVDQNPLSPHGLAVAIREAHEGVDVPPDVRMVLFKYYERELIHDLRELLVDLNGRLAAAGFHAPQAVSAPPPSPVAGAPAGFASAASDYGQPSGAGAQFAGQPNTEDRAVFDALLQLLHAWRPDHDTSTAGSGRSAAPGAPQGGRQTGRGGQRPLVADEMLSVLSLMQSAVPEAVTEAMQRPEVSLAALLKNEVLRSASRIGLPPEKVSISQDDEDAVDLVGMLFDVMFDERDFQQNSREMISRLVVPFVKAAVMDRRMFLYKTHPARRLLNSLAEAVEGNRGDGPQERELLQKAESTVDRLIAEFNEDIAIFETLEQELRAFLEQHRRRVELAERRAAEAQRGQERLEQARVLASHELEKRTPGLSPPPAMQDFLGRCWTHHLSMIALREGPESASWQSALTVADRMLALLPRDGVPAPAVGPALQALREPVETVLASSGITGEAANEMMQAIGEGIDDLVRGREPAPVAAPHATENIVPMPERPQSAAAALAELLKPKLEVVGGKAALDVSPDDVEQLRALKIGTWIHIAGEDGKHHPVKLSWVSPISSRLMFVNRRGVRVLVASVEELAAMKQEGNLLLRDQDNVFDQVLHRVMGKLRTDLG